MIFSENRYTLFRIMLWAGKGRNSHPDFVARRDSLRRTLSQICDSSPAAVGAGPCSVCLI